MDKSQLLTDRTHLNKKFVSGVSDSKKRDLSLQKMVLPQKRSIVPKKRSPRNSEDEEDIEECYYGRKFTKWHQCVEREILYNY
jgi:hypothetical protein